MINKIETENAPLYNSKSIDSDNRAIKKALLILESRLIKKEHYFKCPEDTENYLKIKLADLEHEEFHCLFLDNQHALIKHECLFTGTIDGASVYPREVIKKALQYNAAALIFAHNHPSGVYQPSQADKQITKKIKGCAGLFDIRVLDHMIVGGLDIYSLAQNGDM